MKTRFLLLALLVLAFSALLVPSASLGVGSIPEVHDEGLADTDNRVGDVAATAAQRDRVTALGARASYNDFGTVQSLIKDGGFLATGLGSDPVAAARTFITDNAVLFRLSSAGLSNLKVYEDSKLSGSKAHAVTFRQTFGGTPSLFDGLITVGVVDGNVVYASSSSAGDGGGVASTSISPAQAWVAAAKNAGLGVSIASITRTRSEGGWTVFKVSGFTQEQRVRAGVVPTPKNGVRPAFEALVVSSADGDVQAYRYMIDAGSGAVLVRQNIAENAAQRQQAPTTAAFDGMLAATDGACATEGPFVVPAGTRSIEVIASADLPANDLVLHLLDPAMSTIASQDTGTSPEAIHYEPGGLIPPGGYFVKLCDFVDGSGWVVTTSYHGIFITNDTAAASLPYPPKWKVFKAYPKLGNQSFPYAMPGTDNREIWCWNTLSYTDAPPTGCDRDIANFAGRMPWDANPFAPAASTFTTYGNAAKSAEAWFSPLTPGPTGFMPVDAMRNYVFPFGNDWFDAACSQTSFVVGVSPDVPSATVNLFAQHNRMHDWQYNLGFTENAWNLQENNFGNPTAQNDGLLGDVQAGAFTGGAPTYLGRDNANMVTLPDGVHPITNMYLWQPIAGAFYAPCVDGDFDGAVIGHEYGHATENRMIGKGGTRGGFHAGAMGESFGDFNASEYLNESGFVPVNGESKFVVGAYVTGNHVRGIRNFDQSWAYAGDVPRPGVDPPINPLNFSDLGYDLTGPEVHADGELWNTVQIGIRKALVAKYNGSFPAGNQALQDKCSFGTLAMAPEFCPGNRRWIQLYFDAMLLMPTAPTFLDARDAMLAADVARATDPSWTSNQRELWQEYARHGFGQFAFNSSNGDTDPIPSFESPLPPTDASVKFVAKAPNGSTISNATIYVGWYEARVTPIADTNPATNQPSGENNLNDTAKFTPGTYELLFVAPGYGHFRVRRTFTAGQNTTVTVTMPVNVASSANGATASGDGAGHGNLIDDTEATQWESVNSPPVAGKTVVVDLAGTTAQKITHVQVSTMLRSGQNRFTALRQFHIMRCSSACGAFPVNYSTVLTSAANAFPGTPPRPGSPDLLIRDFVLASSVNATHLAIVVDTTQCTGGPGFQGEQDADPTNSTDCDLDSANGDDVRITELQAFGTAGSGGGTQPPPPPPPPDDECDDDDDDDLRFTAGPSTATPSSLVTYSITYTNSSKDDDDDDCDEDDILAQAMSFVSATSGGSYNSSTRTITWHTGPIAPGASKTVSFTARVSGTVAVGTSLVNKVSVSPTRTATFTTLVVK